MRVFGFRLPAFFWALVACSLVTATVSCDLLEDASGDDDGDDPITLTYLAGTWLEIFSSPYTVDAGDNVTADAFIIEFDGTDYEMVFYKNSEQVYGRRGTISISGLQLNDTATYEWSRTDYWHSDADSYTIPYSYSDGALTLTGPGGDIALEKVTFTRPTALVGPWKTADSAERFTLNSGGAYSYSSTGSSAGEESGDPWDVTGTTSGYFRNTSLQRDFGTSESGAISYLTPYQVVGSNLVLTYPTGDVTFQPDPASITMDTLAGSWLEVFSTDYTDGSMTADAYIIEFDGSNYEMVFYNDTEQVYGRRGTMSISGSQLVESATQEWDSTNYWHSDTDANNIPYTYSGGVLTVTAPGGAIALEKVTFTRPTDFVATWQTAGAVETITLNSAGTYTYSSTGSPAGTESGEPWDVTGTTSGYFRSVTLQRNYGSAQTVHISYLTPYQVVSSNLVLTYPSGPVTFIKQ